MQVHLCKWLQTLVNGQAKAQKLQKDMLTSPLIRKWKVIIKDSRIQGWPKSYVLLHTPKFKDMVRHTDMLSFHGHQASL